MATRQLVERRNTYQAVAVLNDDSEQLLGLADSYGASTEQAVERLADLSGEELARVGVVRFSRWHGVSDAGQWKFVGQRPASNFAAAIAKAKAKRARQEEDEADWEE